MKQQSGSHRTQPRLGRANFVFAFHDCEEIGPDQRPDAAPARHREHHLVAGHRAEPRVVDLAHIQDLYGHTGASTTRICATPTLAEQRDAVKRLPVVRAG